VLLKLCGCSVDKYAGIVFVFAALGALASSVSSVCMLAPYADHFIAELNFSVIGFSTVWLIAILFSAAVKPLLRMLVESCGSRITLLIGASLQAGALFMLSVADGPTFAACALIILRLASNGMNDIACRYCMNQWFTERRNSLLHVVMHALNAAMFLLPVAEIKLMQAFHWRATLRIVAGTTGILLLSCSVFLRSKPGNNFSSAVELSFTTAENCIMEGFTAEGSLESYTAWDAVRTRMFWALVLCWIVQVVPWTALNLLLWPTLRASHSDINGAVAYYVLLAICAFLSSLTSKALIDRVPMHRKHFSVMMSSFIMMVAMLIAGRFVPFSSRGMACIGACLGLYMGTSTAVSTTVLAALYGRAGLAGIKGLYVTFEQLAVAVGPLIAASMHQRVHVDASSLFWVFAGLQAGAIFVIFVIRRPVRPVHARETALVG